MHGQPIIKRNDISVVSIITLSLYVCQF